MNKSKVLLVLILLLLVIVVSIPILFGSKQNPLTSTFGKKMLADADVLETVNLNSTTPQFKLHVQVHTDFKSTPQKLILKDKATNAAQIELPLVLSAYPNECVHHDAMIGTMKKWDTNWFTVADITSVDDSYSPKLASRYSVEIVYQDGNTQVVNSSEAEIGDVCYQVAKAVPQTPTVEQQVEN